MTIKALYVDDDEDLGTIVGMCLEFYDQFTVKYVSSGQEALVTAEEWQPDIILLDVMMPEMDGTTTRKHLLEHPDTRNIPVIFMTAKTVADDLNKLNSLNVLGTIAKPFDPETICADVSRMLAEVAA